jgi:hypothetical protein
MESHEGAQGKIPCEGTDRRGTMEQRELIVRRISKSSTKNQGSHR